MNVEYIHYEVPTAHLADFCTAMGHALTLLDREPEVLAYELVQNSDHPEKLVVRIEWEQRDSQRRYLGKPEYAAFIALIKPFHGFLTSMQFHDPIGKGLRR